MFNTIINFKKTKRREKTKNEWEEKKGRRDREGRGGEGC